MATVAATMKADPADAVASATTAAIRRKHDGNASATDAILHASATACNSDATAVWDATATAGLPAAVEPGKWNVTVRGGSA